MKKKKKVIGGVVIIGAIIVVAILLLISTVRVPAGYIAVLVSGTSILYILKITLKICRQLRSKNNLCMK